MDWLPELHNEHPEAGDEWTAKAILLGAEFYVDYSVYGNLWVARLPGKKKQYFGVTISRACRKLVRSQLPLEKAFIRRKP